MSVTTHRDYRGSIQRTVSFTPFDRGGRNIQEIKTRLVIKWRNQRDIYMHELLRQQAEMRELPRTKKGRIYKRYQDQYNELRQSIEQLEKQMNREKNKYWRARRQEAEMSHAPVFNMLFDLWCTYDNSPLYKTI
jgi:hypothetical protein